MGTDENRGGRGDSVYGILIRPKYIFHVGNWLKNSIFIDTLQTSCHYTKGLGKIKVMKARKIKATPLFRPLGNETWALESGIGGLFSCFARDSRRGTPPGPTRPSRRLRVGAGPFGIRDGIAAPSMSRTASGTAVWSLKPQLGSTIHTRQYLAECKWE